MSDTVIARRSRRGNPGVLKRIGELLDCHAPKRGLAMTALDMIQS